jgi:hypothetical protein
MAEVTTAMTCAGLSIALVVCALVPGAAQEDPFNGTWKLDVAKSKMQPATASKSETIRYRITGDEGTND